MTSNHKEPTTDHPPATQPHTSEPDRFDTPMWRSIKKGTALGFVVGFAIAQYIMTAQSTDTPIGTFYEGNVLLLFAAWVGLGAALGAGIGWFNARGSENR